MKLLHMAIWVVLLLVLPLPSCIAQSSSQLIILGGYKSVELGYIQEDPEFLNFGVSVGIQDAKIAERRANVNDIYKKVHQFNDKVIPVGFALVGASFSPITITGKLGCAYLSQRINTIQDNQKLYFAVGVIVSHELNDRLSILGSYDNVSSLQIGINYNL